MIYINNQWITDEQALISIKDRGLLLADGIFETLRAQQGQLLALSAHWQRLEKAASQLALPLPLNCEQFAQISLQLLQTNQLMTQAGIRLTITRGLGDRGLAFPPKTRPTFFITSFAVAPTKSTYKLQASKWIRNEYSPLTQIKSLAYTENILAYRQAQQANYDDAILLNTQGHVVCATTANLFLLKQKTLYTPALTEGALPGVTRRQIIALAPSLHLQVVETAITLEQLQTADEVFITNSIKGVQIITQVNEKCFSAHSISQQLLQLWVQHNQITS